MRNLVISQEAVQEFQTVTNFSTEFGRVAAGLQNAFTRWGSNTPRGSMYLFPRQRALRSRPFLIVDTASKPDFERLNGALPQRGIAERMGGTTKLCKSRTPGILLELSA